jgi:hypothetical protein
LKCKSIIEIEKQLRKEEQKKNGQKGVTNRDKKMLFVQKDAFCPGCHTRDKRALA